MLFGSPSVASSIRKIERIARKGLPLTGPLATEQSESIRYELEALLGSMPQSREREQGHRALAYVEALHHLDKDDHGEAVLSLAPVAMARHVERGYGDGKGEPDAMLSNAYFLLGRSYLPYAQWGLCAQLFYYATITSKSRELIRHSGSLALICASHEGGEIYEGLRPQLEGITAVVDQAITALEGVHGRLELSRDPAWYSSLWSLGTLPATLIVEQVTGALNQKGRHQEAILLCNSALQRIDGGVESDHLRAAILQSRANARLGLEHYEDAIDDADRSWNLSERLRYGNADHVIRESAWQRFLEARSVALQAAVRLDDSERVAAYIQKDRLRAILATSLEVTEEDHSNVSQTAAGRDLRGSDPIASTEGEPSATSVPEALFHALGHVWRSTRLVPPDVSPTSIAEMTVPWWLGIARYGTHLYWSVIRHGVGFESGSSDLTGSNLGELLLDIEAELTGYPRPDGRFISFDPLYHLAEWGTDEERIATLVLGELLPDTIVKALRAVPPGQSLPLVIASGAGLEGVPWPILQIGTPDGSGFRLIERARIRHWLSDHVEASRVTKADPPPGLELLVVIDDPGGELRGQSVFLRNHAKAYFTSTTKPNNNPKLQLREALYELCDGADGIFFYRGHAESMIDPAMVAIMLPIPENKTAERVVQAIEFFARFDDGARFLPLPSRVILSCCSSSSTSLFGGEGIGLAAACIVGGGAQEVIATGRDVLDCSFTSAFDDLLAEAMTDPSPHDEVLRRIQLRMYDEWRTFSVRGGIEVGDDVRFPHPLVWAMYQAV